MTPQDRRLLSDDFLARSDAEFNPGGNDQIAAEILWGAAAQLLLIEIHGEPTLNFTDHGSYRDAAILLQARSAGSVVLTDFECANKLHGHFYHGHLTAHDLRSCRRITKRFIQRLGDFLDQSKQTSPPHSTDLANHQANMSHSGFGKAMKSKSTLPDAWLRDTSASWTPLARICGNDLRWTRHYPHLNSTYRNDRNTVYAVAKLD